MKLTIKVLYFFIIFFSLFNIYSSAYSQKKVETVIYRDTIVSVGDLKIRLSRAISKADYIKCKMQILYPLSEFMLFKKNGISAISPNGINHLIKDIEILPFEDRSKTISCNGASMLNGTIKLKFDSLLIASELQNNVNFENLRLPTKLNSTVKYNDYIITVLAYNNESGKLMLKFSIQNTDYKKICFFDGSKVKLKTSSGIVFEQYKPNPKVYNISPNDKRSFTIKYDITKETSNDFLIIDFSNSTFEYDLIPVNNLGETILKIDYQKTSDKNKIPITELKQIFKPDSIISITNEVDSSFVNNFTSFKYESPRKQINYELYEKCVNNDFKKNSNINEIPSEFILNEAEFKKKVFENIPFEYKNKELYKNVIESYINYNISAKNDVIKNGYIYRDWKEMNDFLEKVLYKTIPSDTITKYGIKIFLIKDSNINASMIADGSIYINVGLFANINNEAELALTIAHEVSHLINQDNFNEYLIASQQKERNNYKFSINGLPIDGRIVAKKLINDYSRECESKADIYSINLSHNSDYDIFTGAGEFELFYNIEQSSSLKRSNGITNFLIGSTHPESESRYFNLTKNIKADSTKKLFLVDECLFYNLRQQCIYETLGKLLCDNNSHEAFEYALNLYIRNPKNQQYLHSVLEAIRLITYWSQKLNNEDIILKNYNVNHAKKITENDKIYQNRVSKSGKNILSKVFYIKPEDFDKYGISELIITDSGRLITYKNLFDKLSQKINKDTCIECLLTIGLKKFIDKEDYSYYLQEYEKSEKAKYKTVASKLLSKDKAFSSRDKIIIIRKSVMCL